MKRISFVHCSDLHLGCQQFNEIQRWQDFGAAFAQVVDYCLDKQVDFLLIGGDLFHQRSINAPTLAQALGHLSRLKAAGIKVFAIEGNHDKAFYLERDSWMGFLHNQGYITLLKPDFSEGRLVITPYDGTAGALLEYQGVRIIGLGYLGAATRQRLEEAAAQIRREEAFTIVLLHAAVDKLLGQDLAGVKRDVFDNFAGAVDYFALGHIHSRQESGDLLFNPGAPEHVHLDEAREGSAKGFYHVSVTGKAKEVTFIPSNPRPVRRFVLDLQQTAEPAEVIPLVYQVLGRSDLHGLRQPLVQLVLNGTISYSAHTIDTGALSAAVKERFGCLAVEVLNNVNLPPVRTGPGAGFDRNMIERHVLVQMVEEEKPELRDLAGQIVEVILQVKQDVLAGNHEEDIIAAVEELVGNLPVPEAAAAGEEAGSDEN